MIAPGIGLVFTGLVGVRARWMVVTGTIVTLVGLALFYQHLTDHWESWAYPWALVGLGDAGLGLAVAGVIHGDAAGVRQGVQYMLSGGALFAVGLLYRRRAVRLTALIISLPVLAAAGWLLAASILYSPVYVVRAITWANPTLATI